MILAIDTAMLFSSVAVLERGEVIFAEAGTSLRSHAEELGPMLQRAIGERADELTSVVVGRGPGSFAGLRVGLVAGQTIGWALDLPVIGVCTLDAIAMNANSRFTGYVVTDARRLELYYGRYLAGKRQSGPEVASRERLLELVGSNEVVGDVDLMAATDRKASGKTSVDPRSLAAVALAAVAGQVTDPPRPYYVRAPDISEPAPAKSMFGSKNTGDQS
jgi:tRNA threonylcarbamoyl adenosine modification protein YeaZ